MTFRSTSFTLASGHLNLWGPRRRIMPKRSRLPILLVLAVGLSSARSPPLIVPTLEKAVATPTLLDFHSLENKYVTFQKPLPAVCVLPDRQRARARAREKLPTLTKRLVDVWAECLSWWCEVWAWGQGAQRSDRQGGSHFGESQNLNQDELSQ